MKMDFYLMTSANADLSRTVGPLMAREGWKLMTGQRLPLPSVCSPVELVIVPWKKKRKLDLINRLERAAGVGG